MRWAGQEVSSEAAGDPTALPGLDRLNNLVRSVRTPEFAGITFHEVLGEVGAQSCAKGSCTPLQLDGQSVSRL